MNREDISSPRSFEDILRRLNTVQKNVKANLETLTKVNNELNNFVLSTVDKITKLQKQIDGNITTWFQEGVPTLNGNPTIEWENYDAHLGDLYYDTLTGYCYRFAKQNNIYIWIKITDTDVTEALALANGAQDTADGKRRVFLETPKPPYDKGDLYLKNQELFVCNVDKKTGTYEENDFITATKYTDDTKANEVLGNLNTFVNVTYKNAMDNLTNQIDGKISTWFYSGEPSLENAPANEWSTEELKLSHTGDLYYDKDTGHSYIFEKASNEYLWSKITDTDVTEALALANGAQDTADSKRRIFLITPEPPYDNGDLWIKDNEIFICQISKGKGQPYEEQDFINNLKYTDNTVANAIIDELGGKTTTVLKGQVVLITNSFAKFTDLADPNSSTTIAGENITTGNIKSQNYIKDEKGMKINLEDGTIDTKNFKVDENGNVSLGDGAKVIGGAGMMTNLSFENLEWTELGYETENFAGTNKYRYIELSVYIPDNFTIVEARLTIEHIPIRWYDAGVSIWGNARNVKVYKDSETSNFYKEYPIFPTEDISADDIYSSEIVGAFGSNGFTSKFPNNNSHTKEIVTSGNIASALGKGSTKLQIRTGNAIPAYNPDLTDPELILPMQTNVLNQTGMAKAVINISGFMAYPKS